MKIFKLGNSRAQPYCIRTAPIVFFLSDSRDSFAKRASKTLANVLEPQGPSMYTLKELFTSFQVSFIMY